jgi:O-antigen/teichoic acid export membrane protein
MRQKITAFLLSALVFPGLGQLYNQDRRKGVILVLAANGLIGLTLLLGLILISREYTLVFFPRPLTWDIGHQLLFDTLAHPLFWVPFGTLLALWGYAAVDAARRAGPPASEES